MNEESLFAGALEHRPGNDRLKYLVEVCGGDFALRQRLDELLAADEDADGLLDHIPNFPDHSLGAGSSSSTVGLSVAVGSIVAGRYQLIELIGEGGMGDVYLAEQSTPVRRKVALKLIKSSVATLTAMLRFEQERQSLAVMDHPHIAKVFDGGITECGRPYFVMEYIKGVPITEYCDRVSMPLRKRLELFMEACHAVQHAHQKGIIHRDLKPSNILVALYDGKPVTKVIDFGLAKTINRPLADNLLNTGHAVVMGTPLYMSPEQAMLNNLDIDMRSDIYTLGVVLYELITGSTPISRERIQNASWDESLRLVREDEPPTPSARLSSAAGLSNLALLRQQEPTRLPRIVKGELDWIVMMAMEKDRSRRYETASNFATDILNYLNDDPVVACPPSAVYLLRKFGRRNKLAIVTSAIVAAALILGLAGTAWQAMRATLAEAAAIAERDEKELARRDAIASAEREHRARQAEVQQRQAADAARDKVEQLRQNAEAEFRRAINFISVFVQSLCIKESDRLPSRSNENDTLARDVRSYFDTIIENADTSYDGQLRRGITQIHLARIAVVLRDWSQCRIDFGLASESFKQLAENHRQNPTPTIELAQCQYIWGLHLWAHGEMASAKERFRSAAEAFRAANNQDPNHKRAACLRAYFLVTCPDPELRAPDVALELLGPWMSNEPTNNSSLVNFIASCAMYRLDDWKKALQYGAHIVDKAENSEISKLVSAMANWKLGEQRLAFGSMREYVRKRESASWSYEDEDAIWGEASALLEAPELGPPIR